MDQDKYGHGVRASTLWGKGGITNRTGVFTWLYNHLYWVLIVCLIAEAIDIATVLRRFAQKEAAQRAPAGRNAADQR